MTKYLFSLIIILLLSISAIFSQSNQGSLEIKGSAKLDRSPLLGTNIEVYKNGSLEESYPSDSKGRFSFAIDLNAQYELVAVKQGYYSKRLSFNTQMPNDELGVWNYKFVVTMIPVIEGFDASLLDKPIGIIMYVDKVGEFDYDEGYTFNMLKKLEALMKDYERAKKKEFERVIEKADIAFQNKDYKGAIALYTKAINIDPYDPYPDDQIYVIDRIIAQDDNVQKNYDKNILDADSYFYKDDFTNAKKYYNKALKYLQMDYPVDQIALIDNKLNDKNTLAAELAAKEKAYTEVISDADRLFIAKQYDSALSKYTEASSIKPTEQYPKDKITEIDILMLQIAEQLKKDVEGNYLRLIAAADVSFNKKEYEPAKVKYISALGLKSNESYPKQKISEIDKILAELATKKSEYDIAIARADNNFNSDKWQEAKTDYQLALSIFPKEQYPQTRLNEIGNKLLSLKNVDDQQKAREKAYNDAIIKGDALFTQKKYQESKNSFSQALALKTTEVYPKQKITEIDKLIAAQKTLDTRYNTAIASANQYFINEKYNEAKITYTKAIQIKPNEDYPKKKITEIDLLVASQQRFDKQYQTIIATADKLFNEKKYNDARASYTSGLQIKPNEAYLKQKVTEIDNLLTGAAAQDSKYKSAITLADNSLSNKSYYEALASYKTATSIKPNEQYPKQKIIEVNKLIEDVRKNEAAYNHYIKLADESFTNNNLELAKGQYQDALRLKPNEEHPKQRITAVNKLLADQARLTADKEKIEFDYLMFIKQGDANFDQNKYQQAKVGYVRASQLKPNEAYPKNRLSEIESMLDMLAARQKAYDEKMIQGASQYNSKNYKGALVTYQEATNIKPDELLPKKKISEIQGIINSNSKQQEKYNGFIYQADKQFNDKKYSDAKNFYEQAQFILPNEEYPKHQIEIIGTLMAASARRDAELKAIVKSYNIKIAEADKQFSSKNYNNALSAYMDAKMIKADEKYPDQQISKINSIIKNNAAQLEANYKKAIAAGDQLKTSKSYSDAKAQYNIALSLKPGDAVAKSRISLVDNLIEKDKLAKQRQDKIDADYKQYIAQADGAYKANSYSTAIAIYKKAKSIKPNEKYPTNQIELCEQKIQEQKNLAAQEEEKRRLAELAAAKSSFNNKDFDYTGQKRDRKFLNDLAKQYPEGITVEHYEKKNKKIKRVIVNRGGIAKEYIEVKYSYGTYYFRNGQNISRSIFYSETKK